ncbi:ferrous iron transport protein A [Catalinimonas alkaloidigena]|uniref:Ferrous iron transport protein A n=1 Tax=Catalinimonas alkaloidigena TaxID=1075417 RepID=A0A1G9LXY9_9BACT|nr:FeoA family protein [Catalinimonas alkaloidigena]SDL66912.1 ferrous iron transport protein A [Catalinimonas alkaloidigena]
MRPRSVADLQVGESAKVCSFCDEPLSLKLLEMGCLPGSQVTLCRKAPLGCPLYLRVQDYHISIRKDEAATILLDV